MFDAVEKSWMMVPVVSMVTVLTALMRVMFQACVEVLRRRFTTAVEQLVAEEERDSSDTASHRPAPLRVRHRRVLFEATPAESWKARSSVDFFDVS